MSLLVNIIIPNYWFIHRSAYDELAWKGTNIYISLDDDNIRHWRSLEKSFVLELKKHLEPFNTHRNIHTDKRRQTQWTLQLCVTEQLDESTFSATCYSTIFKQQRPIRTYANHSLETADNIQSESEVGDTEKGERLKMSLFCISCSLFLVLSRKANAEIKGNLKSKADINFPTEDSLLFWKRVVCWNCTERRLSRR